jgi:thiol-disulfide isomerase/thioredoxin
MDHVEIPGMCVALRIVPVLAGLVLLVSGCGAPERTVRRLSKRQTDEPSEGLKKNDRAPEIVGEDADGKPLKLSDFRGKVVLLDFWAHWCTYCRAMIPHERQLVERLEGRPFVLLGVNTDEDRKDLLRTQIDEQITWRSWWDGKDRSIAKEYNVSGLPKLILLDERGVIRWISSGKPPDSVLDSVVDELLKEVEELGDKQASSGP